MVPIFILWVPAALGSLQLKNWNGFANQNVVDTDPSLNISYNEPTTRVYIANKSN